MAGMPAPASQTGLREGPPSSDASSSGNARSAEPAMDEKGPADSGSSADMEGPVADEEKAAASEPAAKVEDVPPDGGYGWVVAGCLACCNAMTWGNNTAFGVVLSLYYRDALFPGTSQLAYSFIGGTSIASAFIVAPFSNYVSKRFPFRWSMFAGALCVTLSNIFAGLSKAIWQLVLSQGVLFGVGMGLIFTPSLAILGGWFSRHRALANGLAAAGSGVGALLFSLVTRATTARLGIKYALIINGGICAVVLFPAIALLKSRAKHVEARFEIWDLKLLRHPGFLCLLAWGALCGMGYVVFVYSLVSYATIGLGLSQQDGATLQAILAVGQIVGRPLGGLSLDRFGRLNLSALASIVTGIFILANWLPARSFSPLASFAFFGGAFSGIFWASCGPCAAELVGIKNLAPALSTFWLFNVIPILVAEPIAQALVDYSRDSLGRTGGDTYLISIGFAGGCYMASALFMAGCKVWKQGNARIFVKS